MYVRQPDSQRRQVKIPENYSGHAFRPPSPYSDMPPPTHLPAPQNDWREDEEIVQDSESPPSRGDNESPRQEEAQENGSNKEDTPRDPRGAASIFSSLLPSSILGGKHFPFGHGLGSEEILILAIMLLVYLSGEEKGELDSEFLLMLGLLLFAG